MNKIEQILVLALMIGIVCGLGVASTMLRAHAAEEEGSSDNSDSGSKDDGGSDNSGSDDSSSSEEESKEESKGTDESNSDKSTDNEVKQEDDLPGDVIQSIDRDKLKGSPAEQEQAAIDDYTHDTPGIIKPYPKQPVDDKSFETPKEIKKVWCNEYGWKWSCPHPKPHPENCIKHGDISSHCGPIHHPQKCDNHGFTHECKHHPEHKHPDWCDHHDCHHHEHHTSTHFSDNHHGDVTVKVHVTDYKANDLNDVHLIIGDVYEKNLDLSSEPDTIKVDNLDIDGGDDFAVCLANEDSDEGDCVVTHADNDHDEVNVNLKVL